MIAAGNARVPAGQRNAMLPRPPRSPIIPTIFVPIVARVGFVTVCTFGEGAVH